MLRVACARLLAAAAPDPYFVPYVLAYLLT
jgi:hypothetical protein